jgi:hypothetical protein
MVERQPIRPPEGRDSTMSGFDSREIDVNLIRVGDVIITAGTRYHVRKIEPEPTHPGYVYIYVAGSAKPWHKLLTDTLPVAYL